MGENIVGAFLSAKQKILAFSVVNRPHTGGAWRQHKVEFVQNQPSDRVQELRSRVVAERALNVDLDGRIKDPYLKRQLQFALCTLDDVENFFLGKALQEPRTLAAESV